MSAPRPLDARAVALTISVMWLLIKTSRPSAIAAFSLTTPLFGVVATALVLGEPVGWTLAVSALLEAGGIAVATVFGRGVGQAMPQPARHGAAS